MPNAGLEQEKEVTGTAQNVKAKRGADRRRTSNGEASGIQEAK